MKNKMIKGIKKVEGLNLKLERVGEDLRKAIINNSKKQKELLQEYKKIQQKIQSEEEKINDLKRAQEEKEKEIKRKEEEEYREIEQKEEEIKRDIVENKDEKLEKMVKKQEKIDDKLKKLEYDREYYIQTLNYLSVELPKAEERFSNAKNNGVVQELVEASEKLEHMKREKIEADKKLDKTNARLSMAMLIKIVLNDRSIEKIKKVIEKYNENAKEYGLEPVDLEQFVKERESFNQLKNIRKEQQGKYYKDKYMETLENNLKEGKAKEANGENIKDDNLERIKTLDDKQRKQIELESEQRLKDKRRNSFPVKTIKNIGKGIAKAAGTVVGATILTAKFVGKSAKKLWNKIRRGTNDGLTGVNKLMLDGTTKLREKLEKDAKIYDNRREKLIESMKAGVDENKAVENSNEKSEQQSKDNQQNLEK